MFAENNKRENELRQSLVSKQRRSAAHFYLRFLLFLFGLASAVYAAWYYLLKPYLVSSSPPASLSAPPTVSPGPTPSPTVTHAPTKSFAPTSLVEGFAADTLYFDDFCDAASSASSRWESNGLGSWIFESCWYVQVDYDVEASFAWIGDGYPASLDWDDYFVEVSLASDESDSSSDAASFGLVVRAADADADATAGFTGGYAVTLSIADSLLSIAPVTSTCGVTTSTTPLGFDATSDTIYSLGVNVEGDRLTVYLDGTWMMDYEMLGSCDQGAIALSTAYSDGYFRNITVLNSTFTSDPFF